MPSDTTEAVADFDVRVDANTKWRGVFDALTTSEQECIGNAFDGAVLEAVLDRPVMSASDTTDAWEILIFSCLAPQTARAVFLSTTIAEMEEDVVLGIYADSLACLEEWVAGLDVVATLVALSVDDGEAIGGIVTPFMTCTSDLVISAMLEEAGMALEDLSEEEASCLRTWVADVDWPALLAGSTDDRSVLFDFIPDLISCVPDLFLSSFLEETGMTLEDLSEEEASCLRGWVATTDWPALLAASTDDLSLLLGILPDLSACVPDLFLLSFLEETGMTLEDLSEEEASCLRGWVATTDWPVLLASFTDDLSLLVDIYPDLSYCAPDLWWSGPSVRPWDEVIQEATPVEIGEPSQGELDFEGERVDYFAFQAEEGELYDLGVVLGSLQDSVLDLFDADGTRLAGNDDYGDSLASRLLWRAPATGTYYVQVTDFFAGTGTYTLTIAISEVVDDHANSAGNATPVEIGEPSQGELDYEGDSDYFAFQAEEGEFYQLDVVLGSLQISFLDLFDADGTWLAGNDDYGDSTSSRLIWNAPATGTYYVQVTDFFAGTGTYTLTIAISEVVDDHANSAGNATPVEIGEPSQGELDYGGDSDYFAFQAEEGELYDLGVVLGSLQDSVLDLFDADGTWLAGNDDSTSSRLLWQAPATGTYYVQVADFFAGTGTYTLTVGDSSTLIPPDEGDFTAVTVGWDHSCGIRRDRTVTCWGNNATGQAVPPDGEFVTLAAGRSHTCGIDTRQEIVCWGSDDWGATEAPEGRFIAVTSGADHSCAIRTDRSVGCWGADHAGQADPPPGEFAAVAAGEWHTCGLRNTDQTLTCWGSDNHGQADPPPGRFLNLTAGNWHSCGVRTDGAGVCWGADHAGRADPPADPFRAIAAGWQHTCGITTDNSVVCWGHGEHGQASPPEGKFSAIALGNRHSCGLHTGGAITCWGRPAGQSGRTPSTASVPTPSDVYQYVDPGQPER